MDLKLELLLRAIIELKIGNKLTNPTLDRIDSTKGYLKGNIVICTEQIL